MVNAESESGFRERKQVQLGWGEQYSKRRFHLKNSNDLIDVYGKGWNSPIFSIKSLIGAISRLFGYLGLFSAESLGHTFISVKNYSGVIANKNDVLTNYKFALVIENSCDYVSEKLFDALRSGVIPLYLGPDLRLFGIPDNLVKVIDPFAVSIEPAILSLLDSPDECEMLLKSANDFLSSQEFHQMLNTNVLEKLALDIQECNIGKSRN